MNFESLVMQYLASQGLFLSPQFSIRDNGQEWSCPDFVALDFRKQEIQVVEVTAASNISDLIKKIQNREEQWFRRLKPQLVALDIPVAEWQNIVRVFVRQDCYDHIKSKVENMPDVIVEVIEDIAFSWKWPWKQWQAQPGAPELGC